MDQFVEVSRQGWLSRIGNSFVGSLLGLVLVAVSFWLLWWNEGRAVERADSIAAGADAVVSVSADEVDDDNEGKLVHLSGPLAACPVTTRSRATPASRSEPRRSATP